LALSIVAMRSACSAGRRVGSPWSSFCSQVAALISANMSSVVALPAPSVPRPTVTPCASISVTGALPQPSFRLLTGL
jgi:hypothetical protein